MSEDGGFSDHLLQGVKCKLFPLSPLPSLALLGKVMEWVGKLSK